MSRRRTQKRTRRNRRSTKRNMVRSSNIKKTLNKGVLSILNFVNRGVKLAVNSIK